MSKKVKIIYPAEVGLEVAKKTAPDEMQIVGSEMENIFESNKNIGIFGLAKEALFSGLKSRNILRRLIEIYGEKQVAAMAKDPLIIEKIKSLFPNEPAA